MQWTAILSRGDFLVRLFSLLERQVARDRDGAPQLRIEPLQPFQINARQPFRSKLTFFNPARELSDRRERNVGIGSGKGTVNAAANEAILLPARFYSRQHRIPARRRSQGRFQREFSRASPPFVNAGQGFSPAGGCHCTFRFIQRELHQLFRFGESSDRNLGPHSRSGAKRRRRARRQNRLVLCFDQRRRRHSQHPQRRYGQEFSTRFRHEFSREHA